MNPERLTLKSQEALELAQAEAIRRGQQQVHTDHLARALIESPDALVSRLLANLAVPHDALLADLDTELAKRPSVSGGGAEPGKVYITNELQKALVRAQDEANRLKDDYVSVEHLWLALMEAGSGSAVSRLMAARGVDRDAFLGALTAVRGNQRVTSANPEGTYDALEKYGVDLVAQARDGRLDPVIGRDDEIRRVIRILSSARPPSSKGSLSASCVATFPSGSRTGRSSPSTWGRCSPAPSTAASSRSG